MALSVDYVCVWNFTSENMMLCRVVEEFGGISHKESIDSGRGYGAVLMAIFTGRCLVDGFECFGHVALVVESAFLRNV